jgi:D-beta-D-heptose 7-phosphate kinase/D-beta-D-heptose 1-phosphate adenosyltransferase
VGRVTAEALREVTGRFAGCGILVVGDIILDEYVTGECTRLSPEAPIPVLRVRATRSVLGGAANTAANVASLGGRVVLIGIVGDDEAGRRVGELARAQGIDARLETDRTPTCRKVRALGGQQQLLRLDYEDDGPRASTAIQAVLDQVGQALSGASVLVLSDYAKGLVDQTFGHRLLALAREARVPVVIDPRPQHANAYVGCDYLTPNWKEALSLVGEVDRPATPEAIASVGRRAAERFGANVLLTLGPQGIRYFGRDGVNQFDEPAQTREVFDVSGAGDTVVAAFALAVAAGADPHTAIRLANLAAGVVVAKVGTSTVSREELVRTIDADRLVSGAGLLEHLGDARSAGRRVGIITGEFDALDSRTLAVLRDVRRRVDVVVVLLDAEVRDVAERAQLFAGLRDVDLVCVEASPGELIAALDADVHVEHAGMVARKPKS